MGMDVFGINPQAPEGEYFRRNVWGWSPLATYVETMCQSVIPEGCCIQDWHRNDGCGLPECAAARLADLIETQIQNGEAAEYIAQRDAELAALPDEPCECLNGWIHDGKCRRCGGRRTVRPIDTWFVLGLEDLREFARFARASGGFEIW
jgi:hypothetical protein